MDSRLPRGRLGGALVTTLLTALPIGCAGGPFDHPTGPPPRHAMTPPLPGSVASERSRATLPTLGPGSTLDDYLRFAALNNAELEMKFQEWVAAVERVPQVGALPDPRLTYGAYLGEVETRVGPMQHSVAMSQTFPWFGKLRDRADAAGRHANAAFQRLEAARIALFFEVESAHNELYFLKRSIDLTSDNIELLEQFERVARIRYRVSAAGHPDVIRVQVELGTLEDRRRRFRDLRAPYAARLNAALNRVAQAELPWPAAVAERVITDDDDTLRALARDRNPELIALQEEIEGARIGTEIARKDGWPDVSVGIAWTAIDERGDVSIPENGDDAVLATLSVNLPIWRTKYDAAVREAIARRLATASRRVETVNQLSSALEQALFEHHDARRRIELYRDTLIPKATESLQASLGGFEQGTTDFLDLIDTERTLLEFQLALERALVDRATSHARVESLIGGRHANAGTPAHTSSPSEMETP